MSNLIKDVLRFSLASFQIGNGISGRKLRISTGNTDKVAYLLSSPFETQSVRCKHAEPGIVYHWRGCGEIKKKKGRGQ